jgi:peptidylprolyl isomerase
MTASNERAVAAGDQIKVNYVGRFDNGELFDSSEGREPLEFTVGGEQVIAGFDRAVVVAPADGYGEHVPEMVATIERQQIPDNDKLMLGSMLEVSMEDGQSLEVQVVELSDETVVLDGNHPLAGKELHFEIELLDFV